MDKVRLSLAQAETLYQWYQRTRNSADYYSHITDVFGARNNQDNGNRRIMRHLRDKGLLESIANGLVRSGNPIYPDCVILPNDARYDCIRS